MTKKQVVIVGSIAGGATCATRLRRMDENAEIVVLDRGSYVSFANCGLNCEVGQRAYYACSIPTQHGFRARNLSGGFKTYRVSYPAAGNIPVGVG
jgi:NADH dehydrogenase FAD-containing subunit